MRVSSLVRMGVCLPQGNLAFHANVNHPVLASTGTAARTSSCYRRSSGGTVRMDSCAEQDLSRTTQASHPGSRKRVRAQMSPSSTIETEGPYDPVDESDESLAWAESFELNSQGKVMLKSLRFPETERLLERLGEKRSRAEALFGWLYHDNRLIRDIAETVGVDRDRSRRMGSVTRERIGAVATAEGGLHLEDVQCATDGTRKLVSMLTSGEGTGKKVETVIIPMLRGPRKEPRYTICVSSQVGCAMNCQFCYTGRLGLMANLQTAQIVEQVVSAKRYLESVGDPIPVTGVVFMGMGEPFDNFDRVMRAVKILTDPRAGIRLKASSVTVSTVGLVPEIERFCGDPENGASLAISLHAVTDEVRDKLIPVNRRYPLAKLSKILRTQFPRLSSTAQKSSMEESDAADRCASQPTNEGHRSVDRHTSGQRSDAGPARERGVSSSSAISPADDAPRGIGTMGTSADVVAEQEIRSLPRLTQRGPGRRKCRILAVEYTLLGGVNDSLADAARLVAWLDGISCVVNLITFNPHDGSPFRMSSRSTSSAFRQALLERGQLCTYRDSRGDDEMAACGQLGGESMLGLEAKRPIPVSWVPDAGAAEV